MFRVTNQVRMAFVYFIANNLTNMGRQRESTHNSVDNIKNRSAMVSSGGWSAQFPAVIVPMTRWPFIEGAIRAGCSVAKYLATENQARLDKFTAKQKNATKDAKSLLDFNCWCELYCGDDGKPIVLTEENAYWVHSGHQRTESVFFEAYVEYCTQREANSKLAPEDQVKNFGSFELDVPCLVGDYDTLDDILADQLKANTSAGIQNTLTAADYTKAAVITIGDKEQPLINERGFRRLASQNSVDEGGGLNDGGAPRQAYLIALVNWYYRKACGLYDDLCRPEEINPDGEGKVKNPEYVDFADVSLNQADPRHNISVIARLVEDKLTKLSAYNDKYGPNSKGHLADPTKNPDRMSKIEKEVLQRGYPWSKQELIEWERSVRKHAPTYHQPYVKPKAADPKDTVEKLNALVTSSAVPTLIREYLGQKLASPIKVGDAVPTKADVKVLALADQLDFVYKLDKDVASDATVLTLMGQLDLLRDGDPSAYDKIVGEMEKKVTKALSVVTQKE